MLEPVLGALLIMVMRICDVTIGTVRTILVVQGRRYAAGITGFFEVLIWVFAIRHIMQNLDVIANLFGYAAGFGIGNIMGITIEKRIGLGYVQLNIISRHYAKQIIEKLRNAKHGVTVLPAEGSQGAVSIIICITSRKKQNKVIAMIEEIDKEAFITVHHSLPYRGFIHGARK